MHKSLSGFKSTLFCFYLVFSFSSVFAQNSATTPIDLQKARLVIDSLDKQFAQHFLNGDSIAIFNMYAQGAKFESYKGNEILLYWGNLIRNSIQNDTRNLVFTPTSLSTDSEFLVETGTHEFKNSKGNSKYKGKYLVVWKQEDGKWKLYRDMGL